MFSFINSGGLLVIKLFNTYSLVLSTFENTLNMSQELGKHKHSALFYSMVGLGALVTVGGLATGFTFLALWLMKVNASSSSDSSSSSSSSSSDNVDEEQEEDPPAMKQRLVKADAPVNSQNIPEFFPLGQDNDSDMASF